MKTYKFKINNDQYAARILEYKGDSVRVEVNGIEYLVEVEEEVKKNVPRIVNTPKTAPDLTVPSSGYRTGSSANGITAPIPGLVKAILVKEGDHVSSGDPVCLLEAMKMESEIPADRSGVVKKIVAKEGATVQEGELLVEIGEQA